jgi:hypothetical protein
MCGDENMLVSWLSAEGLWQVRGRSNLSAISSHRENFVTHEMQSNCLRLSAVKKASFDGIFDYRPEFLPGNHLA